MQIVLTYAPNRCKMPECRATREAFRLGLLADGEVWMEMIKSRNLASHTYNETVVKQIVSALRERYHAAFLALETTLSARVE